MRDHLILKLEGVLQSWGEHTFEGLRPSEQFPTRSGIIGLLAACIGIDRRDKDLQQALGDSIQYAARKDQKTWPMVRMTDYHTVKNARKEYSGLKAHDTIVTQREYLQDATFTIALWSTDNAAFSLDQIQEATCKPSELEWREGGCRQGQSIGALCDDQNGRFCR